ncbi:QWRF motif-containing protein 2 isoform X2 [Manihot esculenta]|uniref:Uncharacterized protein n=1 Tax=Manihot esculenta TaxID=3983 RepID=A0ACB7FXK9_MANES|nr:QWRF motif-containing protein 2 isoform X2 [Manihot esculenta]KAG8632677.1 hypothetical protein MANES_18G045100v8 [Manihot esculenta]
MVAAVSTTINPKATPAAAAATHNHNLMRPPLLPSDPDNALAPRRPKSREVTSRYMSSSSSTAKRSSSPSISRPTGMMTPMPSAHSTIKRSHSVERRRPTTPRFLDLRIGNGIGAEVSNAQKMLITSTRSLSVSFQGESFSLQVSKAKPAPSPISSRKGTPERRKATPTPARGADQVENSRPLEQQRWPGRLRQPNSLTRSVDCTDDRKRLTGSGINTNVVRALQISMVDNRSSVESRLNSDSSNIDSEKPIDGNGPDGQSDPPVASDTESVSSGSTSEGISNIGGGRQPQRGQRGIMVPARFWQETNNKLRRQPEPASPVSRTVGLKGSAPTKFITPKRRIDSPVTSPKGVVNSRGQLSPIRGGALRPASPSKLGPLSPVRGVSPSRMRNAAGALVSSNLSNVNDTPSILSFAADIRRSKCGEHRIVEVHLLRILYNRLLQWRFVNARADTALSAQRLNAERNLYNARVTSSKLLESVKEKRRELQWLRQNLKLISILKGQMIYLEELALTDQDFSLSLSGAIEALRASTLRLPVVGGARADVQNVKDAICSAVDVMQAMASSICLLLSKVKECSLRTHFIQVKRVPSSLTTKV